MGDRVELRPNGGLQDRCRALSSESVDEKRAPAPVVSRLDLLVLRDRSDLEEM